MRKFDLFDGHCDTLLRCWDTDSSYFNGGELRENRGDIDLLRVQKCMGNYCQLFAIFGSHDTRPGMSCGEIYEEQYALFCRELEKNRDLIVQCRTAEEAERANRDGKTAAFLAVEGAELLDCDLDKLEEAYRRGVRAVNLTWNCANAISGSSREEPDRGLTEHGRTFVRRMQKLGMLVDVSHLSDPGFWDVAELAEQAGKPFIAGHSNSRRLCAHVRNLTDEQFAEIIKVQGIAGLNMCGEFLGEQPTLDTLVAHVEHWMSLGGENSVAIGGDWDGCSLFPGMADITGVGQLYERLLRLNYPETLIQNIFYNNMMRVVKEVCTTSVQETKTQS